MNKKSLYRIRLTIALVILLCAIAGITGVFYPVRIFDIQFMPLLQRVIANFSITALVLFLIICAVTFLYGRIYCSLICPFGILQEIIGSLKKFLTKMHSLEKWHLYSTGIILNSSVKYFISAILWGIFFGGTAIAVRYLDPYTVFGSAFTLTTCGIIVFLLVIIAVICKDRYFCTNICPAGTILGLISKISLNKIYINKEECISCGMCEKNCPSECINSKEKTVDNEACIKCLKCLEVCPKGRINFGKIPEKIKFNFKRRRIIIASAAILLFGGMVNAGTILKDRLVEKLKDVILPAGAGDKERFFNKCLNCNLCVENCPQKILVKSDNEYGAVHIDYSKGSCDYNCHKCSEVCPSGAIKKISLEEKQKTRIAMAMINGDKCAKCGQCYEVCPVHAIIKTDDNTSLLNASKCIGCGNCKKACHFGAIEIFTIKEQKTL